MEKRKILTDEEAYRILLKLHYVKKPNKLQKVLQRINTIDYNFPLPYPVKKVFKKDPACLLLLNKFISPKYHYHTTDKKIISKEIFFKSTVDKLNVVYNRSPTPKIFDSFICHLIRFFEDSSNYSKLHHFITLITKSQEEVKFLLSFTDKNILYDPYEQSKYDFPEYSETRDDYLTFMHLIGIDTSAIDDRYTYKQPKEEKSLEPFFKIKEDFMDLNTLPTISKSYKDPSFYMTIDQISGSTPFYDCIINHRYFSTIAENIVASEKAKINYDAQSTLPCASKGTEKLHDREYNIEMFQTAYFHLKQNKFSWRVQRVMEILYDQIYEKAIKRRINKGNANGLLMKRVIEGLINLKINWYHSLRYVFINYCESTLRVFPHPEYVELSIANLENFHWRNSSSITKTLYEFSKMIREAHTNGITKEISMNDHNINLLTLFSQYYKTFIRYFFYPVYTQPPFHYMDSSIGWKAIYGNRMKEVISLNGIKEPEEYEQMSNSETTRKFLVKSISAIFENSSSTVSPKNVKVTFVKMGDAVATRVLQDKGPVRGNKRSTFSKNAYIMFE
ncbi:hypothetical protein TRFO_32798 [Tritrichomonas foetus]|uniref:Uncharacterized protein n=1 Tax=Tritrichomonas foetus TaxID=1144522 RepID=A0A1J4JSI3_9EUKA|nr:hypothetical protein TRFO_32798 [Tritrichomonas foetus]|eukprot:OHT00486.1 hypothetical protein TRFO_32798 [Tritrichomonas foetus]